MREKVNVEVNFEESGDALDLEMVGLFGQVSYVYSF